MKRSRETIAEDGEENSCAPISKRINRLSLGHHQCDLLPDSGESCCQRSNNGNHISNLQHQSTCCNSCNHADSCNNSASLARPSGSSCCVSTATYSDGHSDGHSDGQLPCQADISPADSPHYYSVNCQLYRLHLERVRRSQL